MIAELIIYTLLLCLLYWLLFQRRKKRDLELSGGFSHYVGVSMQEKELLRVMVLEELENARRRELYLHVKNSRDQRMIFTIAYIIINLVVIICAYHTRAVVRWCFLVTLTYMILYSITDPVKEVCKAVKSQPNREMYSRPVRFS